MKIRAQAESSSALLDAGKRYRRAGLVPQGRISFEARCPKYVTRSERRAPLAGLLSEVCVEKDIYVAGPSAILESIEGFNAALRAAGWNITFDWTAKVREAGNASPDDPSIRRAAALADLDGVRRAEVLWLVQPSETSTSTGAWVELGAALERRALSRVVTRGQVLPVFIVVSGSSKKCIFSDLADRCFESHDDALEFLLKDYAS
jgi:hypothetical protein